MTHASTTQSTASTDALRRRIMLLVPTILAAVGTTRPAGATYALVMNACDIGLFNDVVGLLVASDLVTHVTHVGHVLTVTTKGATLLADVAKAL